MNVPEKIDQLVASQVADPPKPAPTSATIGEGSREIHAELVVDARLGLGVQLCPRHRDNGKPVFSVRFFRASSVRRLADALVAMADTLERGGRHGTR